MPKTKLRDLVVILPGITGSVLQKDGKDIWNYSSQSVWQLIETFGDSLNQLKLPSDTPITEGFEDGIRATSLVRGAHIIPGLEKVLSGYHLTSQLTALSRHMQYSNGRQIIFYNEAIFG